MRAECGRLGYTSTVYPGIRKPWRGERSHHFGTYYVETGVDKDLLELVIHGIHYHLGCGRGGYRLGEGGEERLEGEQCGESTSGRVVWPSLYIPVLIPGHTCPGGGAPGDRDGGLQRELDGKGDVIGAQVGGVALRYLRDQTWSGQDQVNGRTLEGTGVEEDNPGGHVRGIGDVQPRIIHPCSEGISTVGGRRRRARGR